MHRNMIQSLGVMAVLLALVGFLGMAQELATEQILYIAMPATDVGTLHPHFVTKVGEVGIVSQVVNESIVRYPPGVIDEELIEPGLAEALPEISEDGLTYTFSLRRGIQWHHGYGEVTAGDIKFSLDNVLDPEYGSGTRSKLTHVKEVRVLDKYTVAIDLEYADQFFLSVLARVLMVPQRAVEELGEDFALNPIGTGPFAFDQYLPREKVVLVRNEDYYRGTPILERIEFLFMSDASTRELALRTGEIHGANMPANKETVARLKTAGLLVDPTQPANTFVIHFNMTHSPMDDIRVRQALCHGIDRQDFVELYGAELAAIERSPVPAGYFGHTADVPDYAFDVEEAKSLLATAGYPDGFSLEMFISESDIYIVTMQIIQEQWKKIGVDLNLIVVDHSTYHARIRENANPVVIYGAYRTPLIANIYLTQFYHSDSVVGKETAVVNFSHYGDVDADGDGVIDGVDDLIETARAEPDPERQKELYAEAQQLIKGHAVSFPLYTQAYILARRPSLDLGHPQLSHSFYDITEETRILTE